jgi:uncharacterized SAM-binding protein YcdF (DUF218 family)
VADSAPDQLRASPTAARPIGPSKARRWLIAAAALAGTLMLARWSLTAAGTWLVVEDPLRPARAIVVFGGNVPFRAMEAARLYQQGWAREVWLTRGGFTAEDAALEAAGIHRIEEHTYSRLVLERLGVPTGAIRDLPEHTRNTTEEIRVVARALQEAGGDRVILVTSTYHTRRVRSLWRALVGRDPAAPAAIVRPSSGEPFDPARWWRDSRDAMSVVREWFGLFNMWIGFPVKSEH